MMTSRTSWWQKLQLHRVFTVILAGVTFLVGTALISLGSALPAQAATTPEARSYQVDHSSTQTPKSGQAKADQAGNGLAETVREKLNLNEPLPQGTKLFFKQIQGKDVKVEEPKPGGKGQEPLNE